MLTTFSWVIIQDIFLLVAKIDTTVFFQALAMDILSPNSIKRIWVCLGIFGMRWFNRAFVGFIWIEYPVTLRVTWKILFQYPIIFGHYHQMWIIVPSMWQSPKHNGEEEGYMAASLVGIRYHLVMTLRLASVREELKIPLNDLEKDKCQSSRSHSF